MPSRVHLLRFPISLTDLQSSTNYQNVTCVGGCPPMKKRCPNRLDSQDEIFCHAVQRLQDLSASGLTDLNFSSNLDEGFIGMLEDIARGFSCTQKHRKWPGQANELPYYWIALLILPNFLSCLGFLDDTTRTWIIEPSEVEAAVNQLSPDQLWILNQVLTKLSFVNVSQPDQRETATTSFFLDFVATRLDQDSDEDERFEEAREKWRKWHLVNSEQRLLWNRLLAKSSQEQIGDEDQTSSCKIEPVCSDDDDDEHREFSQSLSSYPAKFQLWRSQLPTETRPAPKKMHDLGSRMLNGNTPRYSQGRPVVTPLQPAGPFPSQKPFRSIRKSIGKSRTKDSRSVSAPLPRPQQAQDGHIQYPKIPENASTLDWQYDRSRSEGGQQNGGILSNNMAISSAIQSNDSETSMTTPGHGLQSSIANRFQQFSNPRRIRFTIFKIFKFMRQCLKEDQNSKEGHIYALSIVNHPGYIKIGFSGKEPEDREKAISKCLSPLQLEPLASLDNFEVPNYKKVEKLVHAELQPYQREVICNKPRCGGGHKEWFKIDESKAVEIIERWKGWMSDEPYDSNRRLNSTEELRIETFKKKDRLNQLIIRKEDENQPDDWDWDTFMRHTNSLIDRLKYHMNRKRPERTSRWRSLAENWQSIANFYLFFFLFSTLVISVAAYTNSWRVSTLGLGVINTLVLGTISVFYAA